MSTSEPPQNSTGATFSHPNRDNWALLLIVLTVLAYLPATQCGYVWDDDQHLTRNPCIIGPLGLKDIWTSPAARICPLVQTTFWVEHAIWGLRPGPYHIANIMVHAACAVLLWRVLLLLGVPGAWLGAALWAMHPVQVETAAWITELKNTQSCLFYLLTIFYFVRWKKAESASPSGRSSWDYSMALLCAALAMASKSSTVILPIVLCLCAWWVDRGWRWQTAWRLLPVCLMSAAASALSIWTQNLEGANNAAWTRSGLDRVIVAGKVVWFYLGKLVWPDPLIFFYPKWRIDASQLTSYFPVVAACAALGVLWYYRATRLRPVFFAFACFVAALLPVLGLIDHYFLRYSFVGDHFQYLASMGPIALAAAALTMAFRFSNARARMLGPAAAGVLLAILGVLTWRQCLSYWDNETLYRTTIERNPGAWMAYNNLGDVYLQKGDASRALFYCRKAEEIKPDDAAVQNTLGKAYRQNGQIEQAVFHYRKALELKPDLAEAYNNLGNAFFANRKSDEAILCYLKAIELEPAYAEAHNNLGHALMQIGREEEGIAHCEKAVGLRPESTVFRSNLAFVLATCPKDSVRNGSRAVTLAQQANEMTGGKQPLVLGVLAAAYAEANKFPAAIVTAENALALVDRKANPDLARALESQLQLYRMQKPFRSPEIQNYQ